MDLRKERRLKARLANIAKLVFVIFMVFKISELAYGWIQRNSYEGEETVTKVEQKEEEPKDGSKSSESNINTDSVAKNDDKEDILLVGNTSLENSNAEPKIIPNTASIYIFGVKGLDSRIANQLAKTFFTGYSVKMVPLGYQREQLLSGNLFSAAHTELVCVGTVDYSFYSNSLQQITCEINLNFDTYNRITGEQVVALSWSEPVSGPGDSNARAKGVALKKIHP